MKLKTAYYFHTFPNPITGQWIKIGLEAEIEEGETARQVLYAIKKETNEFFYESKGHEEKVAAEKKGATLDEDGKTVAGIMLSKDLAELKTFEALSKKTKAIQAAYNNRLKQLQSNGLEQY